eukprot:scaffold2741_cov134-Isochrysis_galbana.AAC.8
MHVRPATRMRFRPTTNSTPHRPERAARGRRRACLRTSAAAAASARTSTSTSALAPPCPWHRGTAATLASMSRIGALFRGALALAASRSRERQPFLAPGERDRHRHAATPACACPWPMQLAAGSRKA